MRIAADMTHGGVKCISFYKQYIKQEYEEESKC